MHTTHILRPAQVVGALLLAAAISACSSSDPEDVLRDAKIAASSEPTAYEAVLVLESATYSLSCYRSAFSCDNGPDIEAVEQLRIAIGEELLKAAEKQELRLVDRALNGHWQAGLWPTSATKAKVVSVLLAAAQEEKAGADVLFFAGVQAKTGENTEQNFVLAISLLERAWLGGHDYAAGSLASIYESLDDHANAYLWAVRCIGRCRAGQSMDNFIKNVDKQSILRVQAMAADRAVLRVDPV